MQTQRRNTNDPANPLMKVAALSISRSRETAGEKASLQVDAMLNFKASDDMKGVARTRDGEEVTVCFSLAISKASLEIRVALDDGSLPEKISLRRVPFVEPLARRTKVEVESREQFKSKAKISGNFGLSPTSVTAGLGASGSGAVTNHREVKSASAYEALSVSATHTNDSIHFEIRPAVGSLTRDGLGSLSGEVFRSPDTSKKLPAGSVRWNSLASNRSVEIAGSVFTDMSSLLVSSVRFIDPNGKEVSWKEMADVASAKRTAANRVGLDLVDFKERLVRQVIRKHLIDQGMVTEGAGIQICSARG